MDALRRSPSPTACWCSRTRPRPTGRGTAAAGRLLGSAAASRSTRARTSARSETAALSAPTTRDRSRLRRLRNLGQRAKGEHVELGYNERLDGLQAALLRVKLEYLDEWNEARRAHAARYRELLPGDAGSWGARRAHASTTCSRPFPGPRWVAAGLREHGIESAVHYAPAVHGHSAWEEHPLRHGDLPISEAWAARGAVAADALRPHAERDRAGGRGGPRGGRVDGLVTPSRITGVSVRTTRAGLPTTTSIVRHVFSYHGAGADHRPLSNCEAGQDHRAGADRRAAADGRERTFERLTAAREWVNVVNVACGPMKTSSSIRRPFHRNTPDLIVTRSPTTTSSST